MTAPPGGRPEINAFYAAVNDNSWSHHARQFFDAWRRQAPIVAVGWGAPHDERRPALPDPALPAVGIGAMEQMRDLVGARRIAFVVWETTIVPRDKVALLRAMDEVWVPSTWGREVFVANGLDAGKVRVVPEGVDVTLFRPDAVRDRSPPRFRFLFVGKWEERKGADLLVEAFRREFAPDEPVELVLHAWNPFVRGFDLDRRIARSLRGPFGRHRSAPITASLPTDEAGLVALYNSCDAFVLPTRAEGWGLPILEAMACALPVIVTGYSAPLDFLDDDVAYLVDVNRQVPVRDRLFFPEGRALGTWAEPDLASLRATMRHVFANPGEARAKGERARVAVRDRWTWDHAVATARRWVREPC